MEYNTDAIDEILKKKIFNSAAFKSSNYKGMLKTSNGSYKNYLLDNENNKLNEYYNFDDGYTGYSFIKSEDDGFTDNGDDVKEGFSYTLPGSPGIAATPDWNWSNTTYNYAGVCWYPCEDCTEACGCCGWGCCCRNCWRHSCSKTCTIAWTTTGTVAGTAGIPGIPAWKINFPDIPSFDDMFKGVKDKINKDVIEPMENDNYVSDTYIEETLKDFFQDYTQEIAAFMVFLFVFFFSVLLTENNSIVCLFALFVSSLFLICIRDA